MPARFTWVASERFALSPFACPLCSSLRSSQLNRPKFPDIPGLHDVYKGSVVHTANWNTATDDPTPTRRVGVIGNGSTGLQVAGAMIDQVKEFWHFVRTPTYIQPYLDPLELTPEMREEWRRKGSENEGRAWRAHVRNIWLDREKYFSMFSGRNHKLNKLVVSRAIANMEKQVADPKLRAQLTPDFAYGCRRPIFHQTYYQLIQRPHAHLVTDDIVRCTKDGIITRDKEGKETYHGPMDQIVCATGFSVNWVNKFCPIQGRGGVTLETLWSERPEACGFCSEASERGVVADERVSLWNQTGAWLFPDSRTWVARAGCFGSPGTGREADNPPDFDST